MNYLRDVMLQAKYQKIPESNLRFQKAKVFSAYMEVSTTYLNQSEIGEETGIDVNPYYRFYDIFKDLFQPNMKDYSQLRENLCNLIFHLLAQNDVLSGMTREEYYKKLLYQDFKDIKFGEKAKETMQLYNREEREIILSGLLTQYETGSSLDIFKDMMNSLINNNIVYLSNQNSYEILIYIGQKKDTILVQKMNFLIEMFLQIPYYVETYYEYHFGIIDIEETMILDEIVLC